MSISNKRLCLVLLLAAVVLPEAAWAGPAIAEPVLAQFQAVLSKASSVLLNIATNLFFLLATVEFALIGIRCILEGKDVESIIGEVAKGVLVTGFFYTALLNGGAWLNAIIASFQTAGQQATAAMGVSILGPDDLINTTLKIVLSVWKGMSAWPQNWGADVMMAILGVVIMLSCGFVACFMVEATVECFFVGTAGILLMGFGGSSFTKDLALKPLHYAVSVGLKFFTLQIISSVSLAILANMTSTGIQSASDIIGIAIMALIMLGLNRSIPTIIQSQISGVSVGSGKAMWSAVGTAAAATVAAAGAVIGGGVGAARAIGAAREGAGAAASGGGGTSGGSAPTPPTPPSGGGQGTSEEGGGSGGPAPSVAGGGSAQAEPSNFRRTAGRLGAGLMRDVSRNSIAGRIADNIRREDLRQKRMK